MQKAAAAGVALVTGLTFFSAACGGGTGAAGADGGKRDARASEAGHRDAATGLDARTHGDAKGPREASASRDAARDSGVLEASDSAIVGDTAPVTCQPVDAGLTFGGPACSACLASACCVQIGACLAPVDGGESPCALLAACVTACQRDGGAASACELSCSDRYPAGIGLAETVNDCLTSSCADDAGGNACVAP